MYTWLDKLTWSKLLEVSNYRFIQNFVIALFFVPILARFVVLINEGLESNISLPTPIVATFLAAIFFVGGLVLITFRCPWVVKRFSNYGDFLSSETPYGEILEYVNGLNGKSRKDFFDELGVRTEVTDTTIDSRNLVITCGETRKVEHSVAFFYLLRTSDQLYRKSRALAASSFLIGGSIVLCLILQNIWIVLRSIA